MINKIINFWYNLPYTWEIEVYIRGVRKYGFKGYKDHRSKVDAAITKMLDDHDRSNQELVAFNKMLQSDLTPDEVTETKIMSPDMTSVFGKDDLPF